MTPAAAAATLLWLGWTYFVPPCYSPERTGCEKHDEQLAIWALEAWAKASDGQLKLERVTDPRKARLQVAWASAAPGQYGEAERVRQPDGSIGVRLNIRPIGRQDKDPLLRDTIVYLTVLHESGHAWGLGHTDDFADIMYSFQYGGDLVEYFARYRRLLKQRSDIPQHSGLSPGDIRNFRAILARAPQATVAGVRRKQHRANEPIAAGSGSHRPAAFLANRSFCPTPPAAFTVNQ